MKEVQKNKTENIKEILEECREKNVTIDDLLEVILIAIDSKNNVEIEETLDKQRINQYITKLLKEMGIPAHIKGYSYIRYSVIYVLENFDTIDKKVTTLLYPEVAKKFETTPSRVERGIRHAISVAWERGNIDFIDECFGYTINPEKGKPTNSEFIAMVVDYIKTYR